MRQNNALQIAFGAMFVVGAVCAVYGLAVVPAHRQVQERFACENKPGHLYVLVPDEHRHVCMMGGVMK